MAPKWITVLFLHFPKELIYGYLRFEGNGKIPLGRQSVKQPFFLQRLSVSDTFKNIYFGLGYDFGRREFRI